MTSVPARAEVPIESTWNHESVFPSFDAWREEYQATIAAVGDIAAYQDTLSQSPARLMPSGSSIARQSPAASGRYTCTR